MCTSETHPQMNCLGYQMPVKWLILMFIFAACSAKAQTPAVTTICSKQPDFYETQKYRVGKVSIGLSFRAGPKLQKLLGISRVQPFLDQSLQEAQADLNVDGRGLTVGETFRNKDGYIAVQDALATDLSELRGGARITFSYITPRLLNCDDGQKTLEVFYGVVSTEPFSYLTSIFEKRTDRITPTMLKGGLVTGAGKLGITPAAGYNRTRGLFGGGQASIDTEKGIMDKVAVGMTASDSSLTAGTALSGSHDFDSGFISHAEWNLAYDYSDIPADEIKLKESTALAQLFLASRTTGNDSWIFRFGTSVETGNRATNLTPLSTPPDSLARSDHTAIKTYVGASGVKNRQSWKASYGLQIGSTSYQIRADYVKQIGDVAYSARFLPKDHKPLRLDFQLTAGTISSNEGRLPVPERFFGGNADSEFIQGDSWRIRSNPFIRSFPQNSLNRVDSFGPIGGMNFFSVNLTLAQTVWNRPLMPPDIVDDPETLSGITAGLVSVRSGLMDSYQEHLPGFPNLHASILKLVEQIEPASKSKADGPLLKLRTKLSNLNPPQDVTPEVAAAIAAAKKGIEDNLFDDIKTTPQLAIEFVDLAKKTPSLTLTSVRSLIVDEATTSLLTTIISGLPPLRDALRNAGQPDPDLDSIEASLTSIRDELWTNLKIVTNFYDPTSVEETVRGLDGATSSLTRLGPLADRIQLQANLELGGLPPSSDDKEVKKRIEAARLYVTKATAAVLYVQQVSGAIIEAKDAVAESKTDDKVANDDIATAKARVDELLIGFGPAVPPLTVRLARTIKDLSREVGKRARIAESSQLSAEANQLSDDAKQLSDEATIILSLHSELHPKARKIALPIIEKLAMPTMLYTERSLGVLFRELNMAAISPFVMFDAARIGPQADRTFGGPRYSIGAGTRFSLANLDLDLGYALNPKRRLFENRGAFVFSLNIYDLFR